MLITFYFPWPLESCASSFCDRDEPRSQGNVSCGPVTCHVTTCYGSLRVHSDYCLMLIAGCPLKGLSWLQRGEIALLCVLWRWMEHVNLNLTFYLALPGGRGHFRSTPFVFILVCCPSRSCGTSLLDLSQVPHCAAGQTGVVWVIGSELWWPRRKSRKLIPMSSKGLASKIACHNFAFLSLDSPVECRETQKQQEKNANILIWLWTPVVQLMLEAELQACSSNLVTAVEVVSWRCRRVGWLLFCCIYQNQS